MGTNSYQGFEVKKHSAIMTVRMFLQVIFMCILLQLMLFLAVARSPTVSLSWELKRVGSMPELYRELVWKWPAARVAHLLSRNPSFRLTAPDRLENWRHDPDGVVTMTAAELVDVFDYGLVLRPIIIPGWVSLLVWPVCWPLACLYFRWGTARAEKCRSCDTHLPESADFDGQRGGLTGACFNLICAPVSRCLRAISDSSHAIAERLSQATVQLGRKRFFRVSFAGGLLLQVIFFGLVENRSISWSLVSSERIPALHRELLWKWPLAKLAQDCSLNPNFSLQARHRSLERLPRDRFGTVTLSAKELVARGDYRAVFLPLEFPSRVSCLSWFIVLPLSYLYCRRATNRIKNDEHIRGARLITEKEIASQLDETGILPIGKILIPESMARRHLLIAGQTGSGKSTVLIQHIAAIQKAKRRAIVNDFKGELVERFYRPGQDLILNPLDSRGLGWTIFNEIASKPDLTAITGSLIPMASGQERFWCAAAQDVFRGLLAFCYEFNLRSNVQLWKAVTSSHHEIAEMCRATASGQAGYAYIQDSSSRQTGSVIAFMISFVSWLEFAPDGPFSLRDWTGNLQDSVIFITNKEEATNIMCPYLSLFADLAGKRFLAQSDTTKVERSIYLILDEMGNMQRLPSVKRLLTMGRSKGVIVEIGIPDFTSIESVYGREDAHTIINSCGSKLVLNLGDPEAARFFSELASEEEYYESNTYYSISQSDSRGGENHNRQVRTRKVIMPAEIMRLPVGHGFFMLPGGNPAPVVIPWTRANQMPVRNQAFLLRPGLSYEELEAKNMEVLTAQEKIKESPVPEELKNLVTENMCKGVRPDLEAAEKILGMEEEKKSGSTKDLSNDDEIGPGENS